MGTCTRNVANKIVLLQVNVEEQKHPLQHLPQGVVVRVHRHLRASTRILPSYLLLATALGSVLVKACFRNRLRLSTLLWEAITMPKGYMSSNTRIFRKKQR